MSNVFGYVLVFETDLYLCKFRCCEVASLETLPQCVSACWELLHSEAFFLLLSNFTGLRLHYLCPADDDDDDDDDEDKESKNKREDEASGSLTESANATREKGVCVCVSVSWFLLLPQMCLCVLTLTLCFPQS